MTTTTMAPTGQLSLSLTTPLFSPAAQAERPDSESRLAAAHAVLARGLAGVRDDPRALAAFLAFRSHFHSYSLNNAVLIWLQRPTSRYCMGFRAWMKHGRRVRRGERGMTVFAPIVTRSTRDDRSKTDSGDKTTTEDEKTVVGYRTATTFDYEQTEAVTSDALVYTPPVARLGDAAPDGLVGRLEAATRALGYTLVYTELGYADGNCRFRDRTITVRASLGMADRAAVLCHELAHALAHDPSGERPSRASMEVQAEGAAFVALSALGLDTARASLPYVKGWAGDDEALMRELTAIDRIARDLLARIEAA